MINIVCRVFVEDFKIGKMPCIVLKTGPQAKNPGIPARKGHRVPKHTGELFLSVQQNFEGNFMHNANISLQLSELSQR